MAMKTEPEKRSIMQTIGKSLLVLVPLMIGLAAGYSHLQIRKQIQDQETVAQFGVAVDVHIDELGLIKIRQTTGPTEKIARADRQVCQAAMRYTPPGGKAIITKRLLSAPLTLCSSHKTGDTIKAWVIPADSRIFILDEDRISPYWSWATLMLFIAFCGLAIVMLRSVLGISRRPLAPKKS